MKHLTRRQLLATSGLAATAALPTIGAEVAAQPVVPLAPLKILVAGAHPDDPETGCGATIARYTSMGYPVTILYLTRGEAGIHGKTHDEAAAIRTAEAEKACKILGAKPVFAGQIDGSTEVSPARYAEYLKLVEAENPDVIFTHWPLDTHLDHRACSLLTYNAWLKLGRQIALYYFEVDLGAQTSHFHPTHYVDVSTTEAAKRDSCMAHESQGPVNGFWTNYHEPMLRFRGMESRYKAAEAFVHHNQSAVGRLP